AELTEIRPLRQPWIAQISSSRQTPWDQFFADSAQEEDGFETPVPPKDGDFFEQASSTPPVGKTSRNRGIRPERDRWFESVFLQRRVHPEAGNVDPFERRSCGMRRVRH